MELAYAAVQADGVLPVTLGRLAFGVASQRLQRFGMQRFRCISAAVSCFLAFLQQFGNCCITFGAFHGWFTTIATFSCSGFVIVAHFELFFKCFLGEGTDFLDVFA